MDNQDQNRDQIDDMKQRLDLMQQNIDFLMQKRMGQVDYLPQSIKQRSMGEANLYVNSGLAANKPTPPPTTSIGKFIYFATDTNTLYIYNGTTYKSVVLS